jgi:hypothetical protein
MRVKLILLPFLLLSCNNPKEIKISEEELQNKEIVFEEESYEYFYYPNDSIFNIDIYYNLLYYIEDFDLQSFKSTPFRTGIFKDEQGFYVSNFKYEIKRTKHWFDDFLDDNDDFNGIKIEVTEPNDSCYFIMSGLNLSIENNYRRINEINHPSYIHPSKPFEFKVNDNKYRLFSSASKTQDFEFQGSDYFDAINYKIYIEDKSRKIIQLLAATPNFDDMMFAVLFVGDLDDDGIPDLIMDTSRKYSYSQLTLYLSSRSKWNEIYQVSAMNSISGC